MKKIKLKETKIMKSFKKNSKVIFAYFLGMIISAGTVYAATSAAGVSFDPSGSGLGSDITNVQSAIDKVYADTVDYNSVKNKTDKIGFYKYTNSETHYSLTWTALYNHTQLTVEVISDGGSSNHSFGVLKEFQEKILLDINIPSSDSSELEETLGYNSTHSKSNAISKIGIYGYVGTKTVKYTANIDISASSDHIQGNIYNIQDLDGNSISKEEFLDGKTYSFTFDYVNYN